MSFVRENQEGNKNQKIRQEIKTRKTERKLKEEKQKGN